MSISTNRKNENNNVSSNRGTGAGDASELWSPGYQPWGSEKQPWLNENRVPNKVATNRQQGLGNVNSNRQ